MEVLARQVSTGGPWNSAIYGEGASTLGNDPLVSERVLVFKFRLCPGLLVSGWGLRLWFWVQREVWVLSSAHTSAAWLAVSVMSLKGNSASR